MHVCSGIYQLGAYPYAITRTLHTALEHVSDAKLLCDFLQVASDAALVLHHTRSADYFQVRDFREVSQNFVLDAASKKRIGFFFAQVFERKHRNAFVRYSQRRLHGITEKHCDASD